MPTPQEYVELANAHLERSQNAAWDPDGEDRANAVTWAFYGYECAIMAAAIVKLQSLSNDRRGNLQAAKPPIPTISTPAARATSCLLSSLPRQEL